MPAKISSCKGSTGVSFIDKMRYDETPLKPSVEDSELKPKESDAGSNEDGLNPAKIMQLEQSWFLYCRK